MTTVYFVRHAQPNVHNHDDCSRELTEKGLLDSKLVTVYLLDKGVYVLLSSPYKRAMDTLADFAKVRKLEITPVSDFRERKVDSGWIHDFHAFCQRQWEDFDYKLSDGESLGEVQRRNIAALDAVLEEYRDKTIAVGSHGTALSTILHYFDPSFGYEDFNRIKSLMPWIVKFTFEDHTCIQIDQINLFDE